MNRRNQQTQNQEVVFDKNTELVSTTDLRGVITYANPAFCQVAGFSEEELKQIEQRAYALGVTSHAVVDETMNYYDSCIKYLVFGFLWSRNTLERCTKRI